MPNHTPGGRRTAPRTVSVVVSAVAVAVGLAVGVAGTFLPWFASGAVARDSHQAAGLVGVFGLAGDADGLLMLWSALPLLCAVCAALLLTPLRRTAAALSLIPALPMGTVAVVAAVQVGNHDGPVGISTTGPVVTATGAGLAIVAAVGVLVSVTAARRRTTDRATRPSGYNSAHTGRGARPDRQDRWAP